MIKNQELANQVLEMMNTALEASEEMMNYLNQGQMQEFEEVSEGLCLMLQSICNIADGLKEEESALNLPAASKSVLVSAMRVRKIAKEDVARACHKIEFELIPLTEEMRINFFYWGTVYPDEAKMKKYEEEDIYWLARNKYIEEAEKTGKYKYDVSITVLAYNKLDYTKQCIASLLKNLPKTFTYELILNNHGSSDGTKEFFEAIHPHKQIDIAVNGGGAGMGSRVTEGKYVIAISNDVLVTKNALDNLYKCICSDEKIAWVVPTTPNVSNLQTIPANYSTMEELEVFAEKNNVSDPNRWEQRVRLCNPIEIWRASHGNQMKAGYRFHSKNPFSFPDDKNALFCRRNGYKMYLAKDAFCHHFGSITLKEDKTTNSQEAFLEGRKVFQQTYGIDPWSTGLCYSYPLFSTLVCDKKGENIRVLGIECGIGSNSLKIKEEIKEKTGNANVFLKNVTANPILQKDLAGISDEVERVDNLLQVHVEDGEYDYIISEDVTLDNNSVYEAIKLFWKWSKEDGVNIIAVPEHVKMQLTEESLHQFYQKYEFVKREDGRYWVLLYK